MHYRTEIVMNDETKTETGEARANGVAAEPEALPEVDSRDREIVELKEEAGQLKEQLLRSLADLDNLRKRAEREKAEATLYAATNFARDILSVSDNMSKALELAHADAIKDAPEAVKNLVAGVEVTNRELLNVFERHGIRRLDPMGEKFDPNIHQAMFEVPTSDQPPGTVVQVLRAGFTIGDRVLRPALVGVAKTP